MTILKDSHAAPGLAAIPSPVDVANIWDMADGALYEDWDMTMGEDAVPAWLCDEDTRRGIAAMLDRRRCKEEKRRLSREVRAAVNWFVEEEEEIQLALLGAGGLMTHLYV